MPVPRNYKAVPVEPTERWIALRWIDEKTSARERAKRTGVGAGFLPELLIVWIDRPLAITGDALSPPVPEADGEEGGARRQDGEGEDDPAEDGDDLDGPLEGKKKTPPIIDFPSYLDQQWRQRDRPLFSLANAEDQRERNGNSVTYYTVVSESGQPGGFAAVFENGGRSIVLFGRCAEDDRRIQEGIWREMANKLKLSETAAVDVVKWERFYAGRPEFIDAPYRLEVRSKLVRGWEAEDTPNYIFVFSTRDEPLRRRLKRDLEAMRLEYERLFPAARAVTAVSTVRICRDEAEYRQYGGPPGSGGYWNWKAKELVFFDYADDKHERGSGKADALIVLYHEAFHQYIYYSVGEVSPHSWYNEGTGDFFSGAQVTGNKVARIGVNPWRVALIKSVVAQGRHIPFKDIFKFEQPEFYNPGRVGICYAQAWSMIYFLRTAKDVAREPTWAKILPVYFDTLKEEYALAMSERTSAEPLTDTERYLVERRAREKALEAALADVDVQALENAWRAFVPTLKDS